MTIGSQQKLSLFAAQKRDIEYAFGEDDIVWLPNIIEHLTKENKDNIDGNSLEMISDITEIIRIARYVILHLILMLVLLNI